jgi:hypothetical protein
MTQAALGWGIIKKSMRNPANEMIRTKCPDDGTFMAVLPIYRPTQYRNASLNATMTVLFHM